MKPVALACALAVAIHQGALAAAPAPAKPAMPPATNAQSATTPAVKDLLEGAQLRIDFSDKLMKRAFKKGQKLDSYAGYRQIKEYRDLLAEVDLMAVPQEMRTDRRAVHLVNRVNTLLAVRVAAFDAALRFLDSQLPSELSRLEDAFEKAKQIHGEAASALAAMKVPA